uniref:Death domain-containing protein n=1 Tax=Strigamia maritima TaxID=126957 RepID=T1IRM9_STRMM
MMGVKIPLRIEEENEEVARPVERMQSSKTAEDNVKGEEEIISKGDVIQAKAMNTETLSTDLKRAHFNIESSRQEISHASSNQKTESLENVKFNVIDDPKMVKILSMKDMMEIPLAGETSNEIINPGAKSATPKLIYRKASLAIGKQLNDNTPEVLFGLKPPVIINKSSSDTDVLKKIADQESQDIKADVSTQEDENSIESTLSTGFIASVKTEGSKISTQSPVPTENKQQEILPDQVSPKQSKGKLEVKTERINRSKKKKLSRQTAGFETEQDVPRNHRSSSLPPLPYTLKDYRQLQLDIQLGGLGPILQKYQRQANYAQQVMDRNRKLLEAKLEKSKTTFAQVMQEASDPSKDARQRGLNYAKNIKKPPKLDKEENKEPTSNRQVKLPPLRPGNLQSEGAAKVVYLETVEEEEPTGVGSTVKTRPFAMDSLMENVEKLRERHAKEREIVDQLFTDKAMVYIRTEMDDYVILKQQFCGSLSNFSNAGAILHESIKIFTQIIDSSRTVSSIKTLEQLLLVLEYRDELSPTNVTILKKWINAMKLPTGLSIVEQYEKLHDICSYEPKCDICHTLMDQSLNFQDEIESHIDDLDDAFDEISHLLGRSWKDFARKCDLSQYEIDDITDNEKRLIDRAYWVFTCWKERAGNSANVVKLIEVLEKCQRKDLADKLRSFNSVEMEKTS